MTLVPATVVSVRPLHIWLVLTVLVASGCERTTNLVDSQRDAAAGLLDASQVIDAALPTEAGRAQCKGGTCACDNGDDDDGDGRIDGLDGECSGPYDDDEGSFATGEDKGGNPKCSDCFFDGNAGPGDDGCDIPVSCAIDGTPAGGSGSCNMCTPNARCIDTCQPRTPNGCDCFGCCEVYTGATFVTVQLVDSCSLADIGNVARCPRCVPSTSQCRNECGRCELCLGRQLDDLPEGCTQPGGGAYTCDNGQVCGDRQPCAGLEYCAQGCCVPVIL